MARDSLIQKRLDELAIKGKAISDNRRSEVANQRTGRRVDYVSIADVKAWGTSVLSLFRQAFGEEGTHTQQFKAAFANAGEFHSLYEIAYAVFMAAKEDFEGGYIFNLRGLVKAEVLSDALDQAKELLDAGYKDPACVLVVVSLEIAIKEIAARNSIPHAKLDKMNTDLYKAGIYNIAKQKQITAWADLRNKGAHGEWSAYSTPDILDMHAGVERFIADHL